MLLLRWRNLIAPVSFPGLLILHPAAVPLHSQLRLPFRSRPNSINRIIWSGIRSAASLRAPQPQVIKEALFVPPGVSKEDVTSNMVLPGSNIVLGPFAGDSRIKQAEFVKSSSRAKDCPKDERPEFAIIGRSNVGKSSLINALVRQKDIALTSKKPGKTQLINHFLINKSWYIVDLPGYGFGKKNPTIHESLGGISKPPKAYKFMRNEQRNGQQAKTDEHRSLRARLPMWDFAWQ